MITFFYADPNPKTVVTVSYRLQCREACRDTETSHLVRAPNFRFGGHEFESPTRRELGALTKSGKILVVRSFYNSIFSPLTHFT